jgi:hypothetical protein
MTISSIFWTENADMLFGRLFIRPVSDKPAEVLQCPLLVHLWSRIRR